MGDSTPTDPNGVNGLKRQADNPCNVGRLRHVLAECPPQLPSIQPTLYGATIAPMMSPDAIEWMEENLQRRVVTRQSGKREPWAPYLVTELPPC